MLPNNLLKSDTLLKLGTLFFDIPKIMVVDDT